MQICMQPMFEEKKKTNRHSFKHTAKNRTLMQSVHVRMMDVHSHTQLSFRIDRLLLCEYLMIIIIYVPMTNNCKWMQMGLSSN